MIFTLICNVAPSFLCAEILVVYSNISVCVSDVQREGSQGLPAQRDPHTKRVQVSQNPLPQEILRLLPCKCPPLESSVTIACTNSTYTSVMIHTLCLIVLVIHIIVYASPLAHL